MNDSKDLKDPTAAKIKSIKPAPVDEKVAEKIKFSSADEKYFRCVFCDHVWDREFIAALFTGRRGIITYCLCKKCAFSPRNREEKRRISRLIQKKITLIASLHNPQPKKPRKK